MSHKFEIKGGASPQDVTVLMDGKPIDVTSVEILVDWNSRTANKVRLEFVPDVS